MKRIKAQWKKQVSLILHLSMSMVTTSCTVSFETFNLNVFPLNLKAVALEITDEFTLISLQPSSTDPCCFTACLAFSAVASLCALPASGPPRTLFFVVKKGIRFVLNPSSLLQVRQNGHMLRTGLQLHAQDTRQCSLTLLKVVGFTAQLLQVPVCFWEMGLKPAVQSLS